jgi:N-glycosylase/DNA lyase
MCENEVWDEIRAIHAQHLQEIERRLDEFAGVWKRHDEREFLKELYFCILTPQSNAHRCWETIERLTEEGLLSHGCEEELAPCLHAARFKNKKASYLCKARERFTAGERLTDTLGMFPSAHAARMWLVKNIDGMGCKEASHFLRNVGWGQDLAILDRHLLATLADAAVLNEMPKSLSTAGYCRIEEQMRRFSWRIEIPMDHLDMAIWYRKKGEFFK